MELSTLPASHPSVSVGKIGVLLVNLGTPDSTGWWDIRRYLKQFLSDPRVIEVNPLLWQVILNVFILTFRPAKTARAYQKIWLKEPNESPLRYYTRQQSAKLSAAMGDEHSQVVVDWAMRYGNPSIESRLQALQDQGCRKVLVIPLYPQYCAATTATVCDEVFRCLGQMRWQPTLRVAHPYDAHPAYIDALAASVQDHLAGLDWQPEVVLASYHGIPKEYFDKGDPYHCYCYKTTRLLREKLGWDAQQLQQSFQSRFGPREWLQPYTDHTLEKLAQSGVKKLAVICPGFAADCVETLEEIDMEAREIFLAAGGEAFTLIPCLNDREDHIAMLRQLVRENIAGF